MKVRKNILSAVLAVMFVSITNDSNAQRNRDEVDTNNYIMDEYLIPEPVINKWQVLADESIKYQEKEFVEHFEEFKLSVNTITVSEDCYENQRKLETEVNSQSVYFEFRYKKCKNKIDDYPEVLGDFRPYIRHKKGKEGKL